MRRLLMICYDFPPAGGIPSLRALRFARESIRFGWQPTVVCSGRAALRQDPSLDISSVKVLRVKGLEWPGLGARVGAVARPGPDRGTAGLKPRVRELARRWFYFPDGQIGWYPLAASAARELLLERRFDAIFSTSQPMTSHLVAMRLSCDSGLPWIADFRDLWSEWSEESLRRRSREAALEKAILAHAAAVTTVSPTYVEHLAQRGAKRVTLLTNGFDREGEASGASLPQVIGYLGTYSSRYQGHIRSALEAVARLRAARDLRLHFVGSWPSELEADLDRLELREATTCTGFLPYAQSVAALSGCGVLLVAGPPHARTPEVRGNVAAKAFEYLAAHRPILMVGDPESDLGRILQAYSRARVVLPGGPAEAARAIEELLAWRPGQAEPSIEAFHSRAITERLARLLDEVVAG